MIQFEPLISWNWAWFIALVISVILVLQLIWILKAELIRERKVIKIALNVGFCLLLIAYIFQPVWFLGKAGEAVLVHSSGYDKKEIRFWKDSLKIRNAIPISKFKGVGNPVYLLGSDFSAIDLLRLGERDFRWISNFESGSVTFLKWKGILREGEVQRINGRIASKDSLEISIRQQGEVLTKNHSELSSGTFNLEFPAKILGRNTLELFANDSLLGPVNFFVYASKPIQYSLQFSFPDAEIRNLTQYLINAGEGVNEKIGISKNAVIRSGDAEPDSLQFLIIDPSQLSKKSTQQAFERGASVLVINGSDAVKDVETLNKALGTSFTVKRVSNEEIRLIQGDFEVAPYEFESHTAQKLLFENAVAIQQVGNAKVGLSLLGKTFPIKLAGDSLSYQGIWEEILTGMRPQESGALEVTQPVFEALQATVLVNQDQFQEDFIRVDSDSVFLQQSLVNPFTKSGSFLSLDSGWVSLADSLEFYSFPTQDWESLQAAKLRADFLTSQSGRDITKVASNSKQKISDWIWYGIFLLVLTLIWLEPKILK